MIRKVHFGSCAFATILVLWEGHQLAAAALIPAEPAYMRNRTFLTTTIDGKLGTPFLYYEDRYASSSPESFANLDPASDRITLDGSWNFAQCVSIFSAILETPYACDAFGCTRETYRYEISLKWDRYLASLDGTIDVIDYPDPFVAIVEAVDESAWSTPNLTGTYVIKGPTETVSGNYSVPVVPNSPFPPRDIGTRRVGLTGPIYSWKLRNGILFTQGPIVEAVVDGRLVRVGVTPVPEAATTSMIAALLLGWTATERKRR